MKLFRQRRETELVLFDNSKGSQKSDVLFGELCEIGLKLLALSERKFRARLALRQLLLPTGSHREALFLDRCVHTSWWTLREQLSTHQVVTVVLPTKEGKVPKIRKGTTPEAIHREIYATLQISAEVMEPVKTWHEPAT